MTRLLPRAPGDAAGTTGDLGPAASGRRLLLPAVAAVTALGLLGCGPPEGRRAASGEAAETGPDRPVSPADSVVDAWIRAAGGLQAWRTVRTARYTVTTVWYDSAGRVERMRPRRVELRKTRRGEESRIERPEAEGLYVQVFNRDTAWATLNGRPLPPDHPAVREAEYVGRDVFYWFGLPYKLRDPGVHLEGERLPGDGVRVRVTFGEGVGAHPGDRYLYYFTDGDPFPEQLHYVEEGSDDRSRTLWRDFRQAGPITYVGTRRYLTEEGRRTLELRVDDVSINPTLPDSLFRPPDRSLARSEVRG